jgi:hypothetical protein
MTWFSSLHPIVQALIATLFTWALTSIEVGSVFMFKTINRHVLDGMPGFCGRSYRSNSRHHCKTAPSICARFGCRSNDIRGSGGINSRITAAIQHRCGYIWGTLRLYFDDDPRCRTGINGELREETNHADQNQLPYERKKMMKGFRYGLARDRHLDMP